MFLRVLSLKYQTRKFILASFQLADSQNPRFLPYFGIRIFSPELAHQLICSFESSRARIWKSHYRLFPFFYYCAPSVYDCVCVCLCAQTREYLEIGVLSAIPKLLFGEGWRMGQLRCSELTGEQGWKFSSPLPACNAPISRGQKINSVRTK